MTVGCLFGLLLLVVPSLGVGEVGPNRAGAQTAAPVSLQCASYSTPVRGWGVVRLAPSASALLYAQNSRDGIVHRSVDGGATWEALRLDATGVQLLAVHPRDPARLYFARPYDRDPDVVDRYGTVYEASPSGPLTALNARPLGLPFLRDDARAPIRQLTISPENPDLILAAAQNRAGSNEHLEALFRSQDGGATWSRFAERTLDGWLDPRRPGTYYAAAVGQDAYSAATYTLRKTSDDGSTWTEIDPAPKLTVRAFALDRFDSDLLYLVKGNATNDLGTKLFRSRDAGRSWVDLNGLTPLAPTPRGQLAAVAADPLVRGSALLLPQDAAPWWTGDGGDTWQRLENAPTFPAGSDPVFAQTGQQLWVLDQSGRTVARCTLSRPVPPPVPTPTTLPTPAADEEASESTQPPGGGIDSSSPPDHTPGPHQPRQRVP